jgi:predicted ester cyclase
VEEFLGGKNPAAFDELVDPNVEAHTGLKPDGPIQGAAQYKQVFSGFSAAFPDVKMKIEDIFPASGDRVVVRFSAVATHKGDFLGIKATHRPITMNETHVLTLRNGRIVENRVSANNFEFELLMAPVLIPMVMPWLTTTR